MDEKTFCYILDQLTGHTGYIYYHLMGEPLTHPQLPLFIRLAGQKGFRSVITTNGTLLPRVGDALLAAGVHKVNISVHSFEENDEAGYLPYLDSVAAFCRAAAATDTIISLRLWNKGFDEGRNDIVLRHLHSAFPENWTENSRGYRIQDRQFLEWGERFQWPDKDAPIQGQKVFCYGMRDHFGILCDGTVVPCCLDSDGVIALGNILQQPLSQILSSPRARAIADGFACRKPTEDLCRRCGFAQRFS